MPFGKSFCWIYQTSAFTLLSISTGVCVDAAAHVDLCVDRFMHVGFQGAAKGIKKYACPLCMALKGQPTDLDAAIARTRRTRSVPRCLKNPRT